MTKRTTKLTKKDLKVRNGGAVKGGARVTDEGPEENRLR